MLSLFASKTPKTVDSLAGDPFDDKWYEVDPGTGYAYASTKFSGVFVNQQIAMTYSACWAATMLLCTAISMIPLKLFRKLPGGGSEPLVDDPRYSLVHDTPNPDMTSMLFRSSRTDQQINWGNGYAEILRDRGGRPVSLEPIHASRIPDGNITRGRDGRLRYKVNLQNGSSREIHADNMLHIPSPMSDDGIIGKGVVTAARRSIGLGISAETHGGSYFGNGARPGIIIKGGKFKTKEDIAEFRRQWDEVHGGGPRNHGKPAMLPPDSDVTTLPFNAQDSQFLETRQFSIDDIARWYGVPQHTIGSLARSTNSNIEQQALELTKYSLMRWTVPHEQEMNRKLLTKEEQKTLFFLHVFEGLERADLATRTAALKEQFFNGEITLNEWRSLENRPPIGPMGDIHFVQAAMVPLEIAAKGPQPTEVIPPMEEDPEDEPSEEQDEESEEDALSALRDEFASQMASLKAPDLSPLVEQLNRQAETQRHLASTMLRDAMGRMLSIEIHSVKHIAEKPNKFDQRLREFYGKHRATMERSLFEPVAVVLSASGSNRAPADVVIAITKEHVTESLKRLDALLDCQADELFGRVEQCVSTWHEERAVVTL